MTYDTFLRWVTLIGALFTFALGREAWGQAEYLVYLWSALGITLAVSGLTVAEIWRRGLSLDPTLIAVWASQGILCFLAGVYTTAYELRYQHPQAALMLCLVAALVTAYTLACQRRMFPPRGMADIAS